MKKAYTLKAFCLTLCLGLLLMVPARANAWGGGGHRIVAQLAMRELAREALTDAKARKARNAIFKILQDGHTSLESAAVWPDTVRRTDPYRYADNWHFVSIPRSETEYNAATQCLVTSTAPEGDCAIGGLAHFKKVFMNSSIQKDRLDALRFIIHFLGDLHQPLHTSEDLSFMHNNKPGDRGGNYRMACFLAVSLNSCTELYDGKRESKNLHATWDKYMIMALHPDELQYIDELDNKIKSMSASERTGFMSGTTMDWAKDSHAVAVAAAYNLGQVKSVTFAHDKTYDEYFFVDKNYAKSNMQRVEDQLMKAGLRLAAFLKEMS
jgi:S1/P1 Nuclease